MGDKSLGKTVATAYPGWAKFICAMLTTVCTGFIPAVGVFVFVTKKRLFPSEETEEFPEQELFNHYDLGSNEPYYPPVMFKQFRRDISVSDDIRSRHRMDIYSDSRSDKSAMSREDISIRSKLPSDTSSLKQFQQQVERPPSQNGYDQPRGAGDLEMQSPPIRMTHDNEGYTGYNKETPIDHDHEFF